MSAPFDLVVVAESESDARRAKLLIDRVLVESIEWLREQPELLDSQRVWRGLDASSSFVDTHKIHRLAKGKVGVPHGRFEDKPVPEDYMSAVRLMWLLNEVGRPQVLLWVRDTDGSSARKQGWASACTKAGETFEVLIGGFPDQCMEAWLLAAWSPVNEEDETRLREQRQLLGFSPCERPERLSHKDHVPKSVKTVCRKLGVDEGVLAQGTLDELGQRGLGCGLAAFIDELAQRLVPALRSG